MSRLALCALPALAAVVVTVSACGSSGDAAASRSTERTTAAVSAPTVAVASTSSASPPACSAAKSAASAKSAAGRPDLAVAIGPDCSLYYYDAPSDHGRQYATIMRLRPDGTSSIVAGGYSSEGTDVPATQRFVDPVRSIAVAPDGAVYLADGTSLARVAHGTYHVLMANSGGAACAYRRGLEGRPASAFTAACPTGVAVGSNGTVYVWAPQLGRVLKIGATGAVTTFAGGGSARNRSGPAVGLALGQTGSIAAGPDGSLFLLDNSSAGNALYRVTPEGTATMIGGGGRKTVESGHTLLGTDLFGYSVSSDPLGRALLVKDTTIATVTAGGAGAVTVFRIGKRTGDGGPAAKASVLGIEGAVADASGAVVFVDSDGNSGELRRLAAGRVTKVVSS